MSDCWLGLIFDHDEYTWAWDSIYDDVKGASIEENNTDNWDPSTINLNKSYAAMFGDNQREWTPATRDHVLCIVCKIRVAKNNEGTSSTITASTVSKVTSSALTVSDPSSTAQSSTVKELTTIITSLSATEQVSTLMSNTTLAQTAITSEADQETVVRTSVSSEIPDTSQTPKTPCSSQTACPVYSTCIPISLTEYRCACSDDLISGHYCEHFDSAALCLREPPCSGRPFLHCFDGIRHTSDCFCEEHLWYVHGKAYSVDDLCEIMYDDAVVPESGPYSWLKYLAPMLGVYTGIIAFAALILKCVSDYRSMQKDFHLWAAHHRHPEAKPVNFMVWLKTETMSMARSVRNKASQIPDMVSQVCNRVSRQIRETFSQIHEKVSRKWTQLTTRQKPREFSVSEWAFQTFKQDDPLAIARIYKSSK